MKAKRTDCSGGYIFSFFFHCWKYRFGNGGDSMVPQNQQGRHRWESCALWDTPRAKLVWWAHPRRASRQSSFSLFGNSLHFRGISERQPVAPFEATKEKIVKMCNAASPNLWKKKVSFLREIHLAAGIRTRETRMSSSSVA